MDSPNNNQFAAQLRTFYDQMSMGVLVVDRQLRIRFLNQWIIARLSSACKHDYGKLVTQSKLLHIQPQIEAVVDRAHSHIISQAFHTWILPLEDNRFQDGYMRQRCFLSPLEIDGSVYAMLQVQDTSDMHLKILQLNDARKETKRTIEAKDTFLFSVFNDIRKPLAGILSKLKPGDDAALSQPDEIVMPGFKNDIDQLLNMVDDVLDPAVADTNRVSSFLELYHVFKLIKKELNLFKRELRERQLDTRIEVSNDLPETVMGDAGRIGRVLHHLLRNAVRFSDVGRISIVVEKCRVRHLRFKVHIQGLWIPDLNLQLLLEEFQAQKIQYPKKYKSFAIELYLVKNLISEMNGHIRGKANPTDGTTFTFEIPYIDTLKIDVEKDETCSQADSLQLILAEDNIMIQQYMGHIIKKKGFGLTIVNNGQELIEALKKDRFDLILLDIQMPVMDGVTAAKIIRTGDMEPWNCDIPIIAVTAYATDRDKERFMKAGINACLSKPVNQEALFKLIRQFFEHKEASATRPVSEQNTGMTGDFKRDIGNFMADVADDPAFIQEIFQSFLEQSRIRMERLKKGFDALDRDEIALAAHKVSGLLASIRLYSTVELSRLVEHYAIEDNVTLCVQPYKDLTVQMQRITDHIQKLLDRL
ncbi:response regulator [Desulfobacter latus]|uniref:Response regulator n=1 Tax=Desulfobacter latus TaxID=2292 RepID=A0A850T7S2_9BACT|nr:response regulator [Desulfobacter latus]NWH05145.1 response regulator [Desulfobacter latus]